MPARRATDGKRKPLTRDSPPEDRSPEIVRRLTEAYPDAHVALKFSNPLEMLVATILSAQCTDERVNMVTQGPDGLFAKYRTPRDYLAVPDTELAADIRPTGFFNNKAKSIRGAARMVVEEFGGRIPDSMEEILKLPGVARKTGNIVLGNSYGVVEGIAVDTHVRRVAQRLGFTDQKDPDKVERDLMGLIPRKRWFDFTYVLIDHGRAVCRAGTPRCEECAVSDLCPSSRV
ncbi:MAG: endonuclease III [Actinomycetota bacterium]